MARPGCSACNSRDNFTDGRVNRSALCSQDKQQQRVAAGSMTGFGYIPTPAIAQTMYGCSAGIADTSPPTPSENSVASLST